MLTEDLDEAVPRYALVATLVGLGISMVHAFRPSPWVWWVLATLCTHPPYPWHRPQPFRWRTALAVLSALGALGWYLALDAWWLTVFVACVRALQWDTRGPGMLLRFAVVYAMPWLYATELVPWLVPRFLYAIMGLRAGLRVLTTRLFEEDEWVWHDAWWSIPPAVAVLRQADLRLVVHACVWWTALDSVLPPHRPIYRVTQLWQHLLALALAFLVREHALWNTDDLYFRMMVFHALDILGWVVTLGAGKLYRRLRGAPREEPVYLLLLQQIQPVHRFRPTTGTWRTDFRYRALCWAAPACWTMWVHAHK